MAEITLAKALKVKNRLTGRLAKVQADIAAYNSVPVGQAEQVNVQTLMKTREELVGALVSLKTAINDANREAQRDIYDLAEKKATAQFLASSRFALLPASRTIHAKRLRMNNPGAILFASASRQQRIAARPPLTQPARWAMRASSER